MLAGRRCRAQESQPPTAGARHSSDGRAGAGGSSGAPVPSILHQLACPGAGGAGPASTRACSGTRSIPGCGRKCAPQHLQPVGGTAPPHPEEHRRLLLRGRVHGQRLHALQSRGGPLNSRADWCTPGQARLSRGSVVPMSSAGKQVQARGTGQCKGFTTCTSESTMQREDQRR